MDKRKIIIITSMLIIVVGSYLTMKFLEAQKELPEKQAQKEIKRFVKATPVAYTSNRVSIRASGRLASQSMVDLISEVQGKISAAGVPLKTGQTFRQGQALVQVYSAEARLALKARKSKFLNLIASLLPDFKIDFPDSYSKWYEFFEAVDLDKNIPKLPEIASPKEKIFLASRNILSEYFGLCSDEIRLQKYTLTAPFNGTFTNVMLESGAVANPGSHIAQMIRTDQYELVVPLEVRNIKWVKKGDNVEITSEDGAIKWQGTIARISNFVEKNTQSLSVFVKIAPRPDAPLYTGQYLNASFEGMVVEKSVEVPRNAIFNSNEVFVIVDGKLQKTIINILKISNKTVLINGIADGMLLVVEPLINAQTGNKVEVL